MNDVYIGGFIHYCRGAVVVDDVDIWGGVGARRSPAMDAFVE